MTVEGKPVTLSCASYFIDDPTEMQPREPALVAIRWKQNSTNTRWRRQVRHLQTEVDVARRRGVMYYMQAILHCRLGDQQHIKN